MRTRGYHSLRPWSSWNLDGTLSKQFADCGLVVWIITPHRKGAAERDGTENTFLSILAGYAEARLGLELRIFIHNEARAVADMEHCSKQFSRNQEIKSLLTTLTAEWSAKVPARKTPAPAASARTLPGHRAAFHRALDGCTLAFGAERSRGARGGKGDGHWDGAGALV